MSEDQGSLFDLDEYTEWKKEWQNMPEFEQKDLTPIQSILVHFESRKDVEEFAKLVDQFLTPETKSIWFPKMTLEKITNKRYVAKDES